MNYIYKALRYNIIKRNIKKNNKFVFRQTECDEKKIFLLFVACGTNMGDHAIVEAEKSFIHDTLGDDVQIIEATVSQCENAIDVIRKEAAMTDIIALSAGGYIGDEYIEVYKPLMRLLKIFRNRNIILLPQTIFFHSEARERRFCNTLKKCKSIQVFSREKISQNIFVRNGIQSALVPDIVFSWKFHYMDECRNNKVLLCLRHDVERKIDNNEQCIISDALTKYGDIVWTDTVVPDVFPIYERRKVLDQMLTMFACSKMVVTDRIHGMIFAYLTKTPCIVIGNYNHKVESEYEWLKESKYIDFLDSISAESVELAANRVLYAQKELSNLNEKFDALREGLIKAYEQ